MSWGLIGAAVIGIVSTVGTTIYQKSEADKLEDERIKAQEEADREAERIRKDARSNVQEEATVTFGNKDTKYGDYTDFLAPSSTKKQSSSGLTSSSTSGLGFS